MTNEVETGHASVWQKRLYAKERRHRGGLDYFPPYDWLGGWMVSMPPSVGWDDIDYIEVGEFHGIGEKMKYRDLIDAHPDDAQHLCALISARCVELDDEIEQAFFDVLEEEGYGVRG